MAYNKIFFHTGPGGNRDGLGRLFTELNAAGIPAGVKAVDDYGPCFELANIAATSAVEHVICFRLSTAGQNDGYDYDVPPYHLTPAEAARTHWQHTLAKLPPEFDREHVWLEVINEVDKNRAGWLGWFGVEIAALANAAGYKVMLFGWSSGEPEPEHWLEPGMVEYLRYCAAHPDHAGVSLHEYSFDLDNIKAGGGNLVGRYRQLHAACEQLGIARPKIIISEWGWQAFDVPDVDTAMQHIDSVAADYAQHDNILMAAVWYLGGGWQSIAQKARQFIGPVRELTLSKVYPGPDPEPPPPPGDECRGDPRIQYGRVYELLHESHTPAEAEFIFRQSIPLRRTVGWSADDAGIGNLDRRTARLHDWPNQTEMVNWYGQHYPGVVVELAASPPPPPPPPPTGNALFGLHATADPVLAMGEAVAFSTARIEVVKCLSNLAPGHVSALGIVRPGATWIVRAFLHFGGRNISPAQFVADTLPDVQRTVGVIGDPNKVWIELHNEPNLYAEGLGASWDSGAQFAVWFQDVLARYRAAMPGYKFIFPGLSPGGDVPGIRQDSAVFIEQARSAVNACDALGVHSYWSASYSMATALDVLDNTLARFPGKPAWITEASNNDRQVAPAVKGHEYIIFWRFLQARPAIRGVTYFVASASHPDFQHEVWVSGGQSKGIAEIVGQRLNGWHESVNRVALAATPAPSPDGSGGGCRGKPRVQYARLYQLLHNSLTTEQAVAVFNAGYTLRRTTGWSADDAGIGDLDSRTADVFGWPAGEQQLLHNWFAEHYPGVVVNFRPVPGASFKLVADVSHHQGAIDWQKLKGKMAGVSEVSEIAVIIRGPLGRAGLDSRLDANYHNSGAAGFLRGMYGLFRPEWTAMDQAVHHLEVYRRYTWELPFACDFELPLVSDFDNIPPAWRDQSGRVREYLFWMRDALGYAPVVYTGKPWWQTYVGLREWARGFPLWLAAYYAPEQTIHPPERFFPGDLPQGWTGDFPSGGWQFTSTLPGREWGVASAGLDMNWLSPQRT